MNADRGRHCPSGNAPRVGRRLRKAVVAAAASLAISVATTDVSRSDLDVLDRSHELSTECFFWATQAGAELDLLVVRGRGRLGFEIERTAAPSMSRSAHIALEDLQLQRLDIVHAGDHSFALE